MATYFISDTHFHHRNILKYEPMRAQKLVEWINAHFHSGCTIEQILTATENQTEDLDMFLDLHDEMLVEAWNNVVTDDDDVWFLGDFCLCDKDYARSICARLKGHKHMIYGNHDRWSIQTYLNMGFETVSKKPVELIAPSGRKFCLSHAPREEMYGGIFYVFGHIHSKPHHSTDSEINATSGKKFCCVCVERHDLLPIQIPEFNGVQ